MTNRRLLSWLSIAFVLPSFMFAFHLSLVSGLVTALGAGLTILLLARAPARTTDGVLSQPANLRDLAICLALALVLVLLGGEGHLVYTNTDWFWRDAVLADLSRSSGLPHYQIAGVLYAMRTSLGMYMAPAAVGQLMGLGWAHAALAVQNATLLGVILYGFSILIPKHRFMRLGALLAFSGLDIIVMIIAIEHTVLFNPLDLPAHINSWAQWQYSAHITQIFWVPNHALPGWWLALLIILCAQGEVSLGRLGLAAAAAVFWSPLVVVGTAPFLLLLFARRFRDNIADRTLYRDFIISLSFLPIAVYLVTGAETITPAAAVGPSPQFPVTLYAVFLYVELAIPLCVLVNWRNNDPRLNALALASVGILVILPLFSFGPGNDLVMRASIPALMILAYLFSFLLIGGPKDQPALRRVALVLAGLGAVTGGVELARVALFPRYAISACDFMSVQREMAPTAFPANYLVRQTDIPNWIVPPVGAGQAVASRSTNCWPDYPFDPRMYPGRHTFREYLSMRMTPRGASSPEPHPNSP